MKNLKTMLLIVVMIASASLLFAEGCVNPEQCRDFCGEDAQAMYCCWYANVSTCCCEYSGVPPGYCAGLYDYCE